MSAVLQDLLRNSRSLLCRSFCSSSVARASADIVGPVLYNRNPRNLERLRIASKLQGFPLDARPKNYWHRLVIEQTNRHTSAHVEHMSGRVVISASTQEWAVKQHLRSNLDLKAVESVGKVLAQRCLECGLVELDLGYDPAEASDKVRLFLKTIEKSGISLSEPERYHPHQHWSREAKEKPWEVLE